MQNPGFTSGDGSSFQTPAAGGQSQGLAIGALVCGILSCVCCFSFITGPAALIMGFIAKKKSDEDPANYGGRGLALAGMITGVLGLVLFVVLVIIQVLFGVMGAIMR